MRRQGDNSSGTIGHAQVVAQERLELDGGCHGSDNDGKRGEKLTLVSTWVLVYCENKNVDQDVDDDWCLC